MPNCDHTVEPIHAGLVKFALYAAGPTRPGDCMLALIKRLAMSVAVALMPKSDDLRLMQALQCMQQMT